MYKNYRCCNGIVNDANYMDQQIWTYQYETEVLHFIRSITEADWISNIKCRLIDLVFYTKSNNQKNIVKKSDYSNLLYKIYKIDNFIYLKPFSSRKNKLIKVY